MTEVKPFIKCVDYWPTQMPQRSMRAYKQMVSEGQILGHHVTYNRTTGTTLVEYYANQPHEWIRSELKRRAEIGEG